MDLAIPLTLMLTLTLTVNRPLHCVYWNRFAKSVMPRHSDGDQCIANKMGTEPIQYLAIVTSLSLSLSLCGNGPTDNNDTLFLAASLSLCGNGPIQF